MSALQRKHSPRAFLRAVRWRLLLGAGLWRAVLGALRETRGAV